MFDPKMSIKIGLNMFNIKIDKTLKNPQIKDSPNKTFSFH